MLNFAAQKENGGDAEKMNDKGFKRSEGFT